MLGGPSHIDDEVKDQQRDVGGQLEAYPTLAMLVELGIATVNRRSASAGGWMAEHPYKTKVKTMTRQ